VTSQSAPKQLPESMQVGQQMLSWQRWAGSCKYPPSPGDEAADVGIVEHAGEDPEGRWPLTTVSRFSDPVPPLKLSETNPVVAGIYSSKRRMGTLIECSSAKEQEVLHLYLCSEQPGKKAE